MLKTTKLSFFVSCCLFFFVSSNSVQAINHNYLSTTIFEPGIKPFDFTISPNPSKENINIQFTENVTGTVYIHDGIIGLQVLELEINNEINKHISLQNLKSGIYFISVKTNAKTVIKRLIKY